MFGLVRLQAAKEGGRKVKIARTAVVVELLKQPELIGQPEMDLIELIANCWSDRRFEDFAPFCNLKVGLS
ncbi:OLC1v1036025C1 [Oldenlandia corymbosa var. corymbosa]|uniref:OLC1v1036025C1 n=1 Tax=Oldenlandia corymbosa var. corymbosa TaxID=529605 RepID=A0AAV1CW91_OLDCO|nr:OLC1v1036025C1 [Oldenlandia corymbosa var. corymbosa]